MLYKVQLDYRKREVLAVRVPFTFKSFRTFCNHVISQHVDAIYMYSASALDLDTVVCFFVFQDIGALPRKIQYLVTDLLVSLHLAQSASQ